MNQLFILWEVIIHWVQDNVEDSHGVVLGVGIYVESMSQFSYNFSTVKDPFSL